MTFAYVKEGVEEGGNLNCEAIDPVQMHPF